MAANVLKNFPLFIHNHLMAEGETTSVGFSSVFILLAFGDYLKYFRYPMATNPSTSNSTNPDSLIIVESVLIKQSLDFSSPWHFSDVVLVVGDTKFHVHKCILSIWSPVFQTMFSSQFVESTAKEIPLPGKRADEIEVLLKCIYSSGTKEKVTEDNYEFLLQLADEYQMDRLTTLCSEFLVEFIESDDCLDFFMMAERLRLKDVTEKCYQDVRYKSSADLEGSESFNGCDPKVKVDICMRVIRELENTLQEYVTTCSSLVEEVYKQVYENFYEDINDVYIPGIRLGPISIFRTGIERQYEDPEEHIQEHEELQKQLKQSLPEAEANGTHVTPKDYNPKYFEFSCSCCINKVQEMEWPGDDDCGCKTILNLKEPLNKLYELQQNNKVAGKAKRMAEQLRNE